MRSIQRILILALFIAVANLVPAFSRDAEFYPFFQPYAPARVVQVMAHRATTSAAPENTLPAFEYAAQNSFEWIEIDVRLSRDGVHVIWHNSTLDGKSNSSGAIKNMSWNELSKVDAGAWFAPRFTETKLLSLQETLQWAKGKINLYLDCKDVDPSQLVKDILDAGMENQVVVYDAPEKLEWVYKTSKGRIPIMAKCGSVEQLEELIQKYHVAIIEVNPDFLTESLIDAAHQRGVYVQVKSLGDDDKEDLWRRAIDLGVDYVQTDRSEYVQSTVFQSSVHEPHCWVSAHRGASRIAPENTRASIQAAVDLHCEFVEVDVRQTVDGKFALLHDSNLDRTTEAKGPLRELTLNALLQIDAGAWFGRNFAGAKIPTLEDAIKIVKDKARIYLDNKETQPQALVDELHRLDAIDDVVIYGGVEELAALHEIEPRLRLMPPLGSVEQIGPIAKRLEPYTFDTRWSALSPELINAAHQAGVKVFSDAMGNESLEEYSKAITWGIDLIQTDQPTLVQRAIEASQNKETKY